MHNILLLKIYNNMVKKLDKNQLAEKIDKILASHQRPYEKKVALFNLVKNLDVGDTEPKNKERINYLFLCVKLAFNNTLLRFVK